MADKRKSTRVAITALAEVNLPDGSSLTTYVANMSRQGIGLYLQKPLEAGTALSIKLNYRDGGGKIKIKQLNGQVKWAYDGFYAIGISIEGLNEKENEDLLQYIESVEERNNL